MFHKISKLHDIRILECDAKGMQLAGGQDAVDLIWSACRQG
jgi:hypothetical protein